MIMIINEKWHMGGESESEYCVPFVSEYTDCTEGWDEEAHNDNTISDNLCSGCSKCTCTAEGKWNCTNIQECPHEDAEDFKSFEDEDIDQALHILQSALKEKAMKEQADSNYPLVPGPEKLDDFLLEAKEVNMEDEILALMRSKRSVDNVARRAVTDNATVIFHHAVDEINEDTLKNQNSSGTIPVNKIDTLPHISRRSNMLSNSTSNSLQIEYTPPKEYNHHDDNKVDTSAIHDDKEDLLVHSNIYNVLGNHSQEGKDKELSKILVNELKGGSSETIGDKRAPVISNITFTPENDTLTAMAFIAGNLLNKLWNMEKDASDDHIDTEVLKHEKIADLLELFKEPLNMRQEMFLKNALEKLSTALNQNKNVENVSLCKNIEEAQKLLVNDNDNKHGDKDKIDCVKNKADSTEKQYNATAAALQKINGVLDLIKKYEYVHHSLRSFKSGQLNDESGSNLNKVLTKDEKSSLDLYGKTLKTITTLLIPNKRSKKVVSSIQKGNTFTSDKDLKKKLFDMKLGNINVTTKDRIVLDYLAHIQRNPDCLLKKQMEKVSMPSIEGNILLNLSEFFKIKSLSDLVKLIEAEKPSVPVFRSQDSTTFNFVEQPTTELIKTANLKQFKDTKEKLKGHLKSILEDLMQLQKEEGKGTKGKDIQIMEALPCIYNLLNAGKEDIKTTKIPSESISTGLSPSGKIEEIFNKLKKELKFAQTRRTSSLNGPRPKSAVVWERVIKNAEKKEKLKTRRNLDEMPITMEELKVIMDKIESWGSNTYKNYAFLNEVPPAERLLLLKTFNADTMRYIKTLEKITKSLQAISVLPKERVNEIHEFLDNVAINVNLNEKVVKNLDKPKKINKITYSIDPKRQMMNKAVLNLQQDVQEQTAYGTKLSRNQIINQLIKNRILLYVQTKEATGENKNDINYDIAKKILLHLEVGNFELARELYKVFASQKEKHNANKNAEHRNIGIPRKSSKYTPRRTLQLEPLIKFEESKPLQMVNQDNLIKQLLNLKNMKL